MIRSVRTTDFAPWSSMNFRTSLLNGEIRAHILAVGEPAIQVRRLGILLGDDRNRYLGRDLVIRSVECDGRNRITPETAAGFPI